MMSTTDTTYVLPRAMRGDARQGLMTRVWRAFVAAQQRKADEIALACLAHLSPEQLHELGHSPSEIRDIKAQSGRAPPYYV